jgi:hypothetical protein
MADIYPGGNFFKDVKVGLLKVFSITYNSEIQFLPYDLRITESLTPEWNQESVIGRMDPIARFKRMGRTMNINFKARAKENLGDAYLPYDDLLHCVDHLKRICYPRFDGDEVMTSPPLFRIKHELIQAGENTNDSGVLCYVTTIKADPIMDKNTVFYKTGTETNNNKIGSLAVGIYPKAFDITIGITVLNEQLATQTKNKIGLGILQKRYFYKFSTPTGPDGGHTSLGGVTTTPTPNTTASDTGTSAQTDASTARVIGEST